MYLEERVDLLEELCKNLIRQIQTLQVKGNDEYLTPLELAKRLHVSQNTIYIWIKEGRIKTLKNLGTAYRIPMSQFYEEEVEGTKDFSKPMEAKAEEQKKNQKGETKSDKLKSEFEDLLKQQGLG